VQKFIVFSRPGVESPLIPIFGIVQECKTSADDTNIWIGVFSGNTVWLSTSNNRN
jgi:hypothetical protein